MDAVKMSIESHPTMSNSSDDNNTVDGAELLAATFEARADDALKILEKDPTLVQIGDPVGDTALHVAVRAGHVSTVSQLIEFLDHHDFTLLDKVLHEGNTHGDTPLHLAVKSGLQELVVLLLSMGPGVVLKLNNDGMSPCDLAERGGYYELLSLMDIRHCHHHAPTNITVWQEDSDDEEEEWLTLHKAARNGNQDVVRRVLEENLDLVDVQDPNGCNVVHVAAASGHVRILMQLAEVVKSSKLKKLILQRNQFDQTALHLAIEGGHEKAALYLIEVQPRATYKADGEGVSPLFLAFEKGYPDVVRYITRSDISQSTRKSLLEDAHKRTLAHLAIDLKNLGMLQAIMDGLPDLIYSSNTKRWKPLSYAASKGCLEEVCYFIKSFPDSVKIHDADGTFPVHKAIGGGYVSIIKEFLLCCPQTLHYVDKQGRNILNIATKYGSKDVLLYLRDEHQSLIKYSVD